MRLILIRHGESDLALRNIIAGQVSCRGLSERGFKQAERLAKRFGATGEVSDCRALLCSPVLRARQTVVVVTHAGFIVVSVLVLFDIPRPGTGTRLDPESTSLTEWRVAQATWRLVWFNDTAHITDGGVYDY